MATLRLIGVASLIPALAVLVGVLIGMPFGSNTSFVLASITGTFGVLAMVRIAQQRRVLHPDRGRGASIGGLVGLALGISLAMISPDQPAIVAAGALLVGIGAMVGSGGGAVS